MPQQDGFHNLLVSILPQLRAQAMALTRNRAAAEDLVHDAVANALAARDSFTLGTDFRGWMHRILYNRFISVVRRARETGCLDDLPGSALAVGAAQEHHLLMQELRAAVARLPAEQRAALLMVALQGMRYEEVAMATSCAMGTAKSRVFRARRQLQAWLMGEAHARGAATRRVPGSADAEDGRTAAAAATTPPVA
ncbi:sigma-70 family RNA polymerase sigma factor [Siccirubricoccus sp. G192]|uniref:sigma-70 family RNA polymerase sigma factor n=1 Tax=Siccirubricoccus sp. G192 TaxID=2849651 RepID=UPI001C2C1EC1|nr:sigma-70 family RNA polymerase sigma factor [Siccirubricoccus sp. G192]MBV1800439.1 sigma-70 family RNA polymerase sigma factor [Siccirubricoccus sp. G192]